MVLHWALVFCGLCGNGTVRSTTRRGIGPTTYNDIPFCALIGCTIIRLVLTLQQIQFIQSRMVTVSTDFVVNPPTQLPDNTPASQSQFLLPTDISDWDVGATDTQRHHYLQHHLFVKPDPIAVAEAPTVYREIKRLERVEQDWPVLPSTLAVCGAHTCQ
jgi:hypothetical protein